MNFLARDSCVVRRNLKKNLKKDKNGLPSYERETVVLRDFKILCYFFVLFFLR